jgi:hypothetical protein
MQAIITKRIVINPYPDFCESTHFLELVWSRNALYSMGTEGQLICSHELVTCLYPEVDASNHILVPHFYTIQLNIILPPTPIAHNGFGHSDKNLVLNSDTSSAYRVQLHFIFIHIKLIILENHTIILLVFQFPQFSHQIYLTYNGNFFSALCSRASSLCFPKRI